MVSKQNQLLIGVGLLLGVGAATVLILKGGDGKVGTGNGDGVVLPPIGDGNGVVPPLTCEQQLISFGENPNDLGQIQLFSPSLFSLIKTTVTLPLISIPVTGPPKNPNQFVIIKAFDRCGRPLRNVNITLSQSTNQWGGFKVGNQDIVSCLSDQPIFKTNSQGEVKIRYMAHHNPGPGAAQSVTIFVKASKDEVVINDNSSMTINGTDRPLFPFDPDRTKEALEGSLTWAGCPGV